MPPFKLRKAPNRNLYWVVDDTGKHFSKEPMPKEDARQQQKALYASESRGAGATHRENVLKRLGLSESQSLSDLAKASKVPLSILQEVYDRGIGAYKTNPTSVRLKGSFVKNVKAPMSAKLSKEQWAMARVYSFLDGNPKHDTDLRGGRAPEPSDEVDERMGRLGQQRDIREKIDDIDDTLRFIQKELYDIQQGLEQYELLDMVGNIISTNDLPDIATQYVSGITYDTPYDDLVDALIRAYQASYTHEMDRRDALESQLAVLEGSGVFSSIKDYAKKAYNEVVNPQSVLRKRIGDITTGIRKEYPPKARSMIQKYADAEIVELVLRRDPIESFINKALNAITAGAFETAKKELNYDKLYHLSLVVGVKKDGVRTNLVVEKNQVIRIAVASLPTPKTEFQNVPVTKKISFSAFMNRGEVAAGSSFFLYDAFTNNCQMFIEGLLRANGMLSPAAKTFILQNTDSLLKRLPSYTSAVARALTDVAALADVALYGKGKRKLRGGAIMPMERAEKLVSDRIRDIMSKPAGPARQARFNELFDDPVQGPVVLDFDAPERTIYLCRQCSSVFSSDTFTRIETVKGTKPCPVCRLDWFVEAPYRYKFPVDQVEAITGKKDDESQSSGAYSPFMFGKPMSSFGSPKNGSGYGAFEERLREIGFSPSAYLRKARAKAKKAGYDPKKLTFAEDGEHKLVMVHDGKKVSFGSAPYGDHAIWSFKEKKGEVEKGYAAQKRTTFRKSHSAMKGDWRKDDYSPNNLALRILWA